MPKNWEEARQWVEAGAGTSLVVRCPRCDRSGQVSRNATGEYVIDWRDDERGWTWRDCAVTVEELRSPEFGCGYDRRSGDGFIGGAPLLQRAAL
jgi:hypothetical protein